MDCASISSLGSKLERESRMKTYNKNNNNNVLEKESKTVTWPHSVHSLRAVSSLLIVAVFITMRERQYNLLSWVEAVRVMIRCWRPTANTTRRHPRPTMFAKIRASLSEQKKPGRIR